MLRQEAREGAAGEVMKVRRRVDLSPPAAAKAGHQAADVSGGNGNDASGPYIARALSR